MVLVATQTSGNKLAQIQRIIPACLFLIVTIVSYCLIMLIVLINTTLSALYCIILLSQFI